MRAWKSYFKVMEEIVEKIETTQQEAIGRAAVLLADTTQKGVSFTVLEQGIPIW